MVNRKRFRSQILMSLLMIVFFGLSNVRAGSNEYGNVKTITVTVQPKGQRVAPALDGNDFIVSEDGVHQEVLSAFPATNENAPLNLAIVIQEGLPQVNNNIDTLKNFIRELPDGSKVMIAYFKGTFLDLQEPFVGNLDEAASRLRIVSSFTNSPASPYTMLLDVMKQFNGLKQGRNEILIISSGIDPLYGYSSGVSPSSNLYLERAIKMAQQENITIFSLFAPPTGMGNFFLSNRGQDSLNYLSNETGGRAFLMGTTGFVAFDGPLNELSRLLNQQYLISYKSANTNKGFRKVKVSTDYSNIVVNAIKGYSPKP